MFDAYALMQAQEQLKINDEQYPQFLTRFKALQDTRRAQHAGAHSAWCRSCAALERRRSRTRRRCKDRLKALRRSTRAPQADMRKAYDAIDQVLDVRQQAQFRVFEENDGAPQARAGHARPPGQPAEAAVP